MTELIKAKEIKPAELFAEDKAVDSILSEITQKAHEVIALPSTEAGRKTIASVAHRVARSKTVLDDMGKDLVRDIKAQAGKVDARRRKIRQVLDALKAEVRLPLTKWEEREEERVAIIETKIAEMRALFYHPINDLVLNSDQIGERRRKLLEFEVDDSFDEFKKQAETNKQEQVAILTKAEADTRKAEEESERLRKAEEALAQAQALADRPARAAEVPAQAERQARGLSGWEVDGGDAKVSGEDLIKESLERRQDAQCEREDQAQENTASQQAKKETEVEKRDRSFSSFIAPTLTTSRTAVDTPDDMAVMDMIRFGATPQIAKMLVIAIQLNQIRCVRFVGDS